MFALPALALFQQLALLSALSVFFIIFSGLLQRI
jgi:hypothetical protein